MVLTRRKYVGRGRKRVTKKRMRVGKMRGGTAPTSELTLQLLNTELKKLKSVTTLTDDNKETISRLIDQIPDYIKDGIDEPNLDDTDIITKLTEYYNTLRNKYRFIINKKPASQPITEQVEEHALSRRESVFNQRNNSQQNSNSGTAAKTLTKNTAVNNLINRYKPASNNGQSYFKNNYYAANITSRSLNNRKDLVKSYLKNTHSVKVENKKQIKLSQQNKKALKNSIPDNLKAKNRLVLIRDINSL